MLKAMARLPLGVLYRFADVTYVLLYYVVRYRRGLVRKNLTSSFPEKTLAEIKRIERQFYLNFADYIFETIKLLHISDEEMLKRMTFSGVDIINKLLDEKRSIVAYFSHTGNWEWAPSVTLHCPRAVERGDRFCQIYRPLKNKHFDNLMLKIRSRFGSVSIAKKLTLRQLLSYRRDSLTSITGFMSDQKPSHGDPVYFVKFLGHDTAVITGTETLARRLDMAVIYWDMSKSSRGHYNIDVKLISDHVADMEEMSITNTYFNLLEQTIRRDPAIWLWSHNRWKKPPNIV
jgi:KDO2-lipid IV(A) lauroyltransferase